MNKKEEKNIEKVQVEQVQKDLSLYIVQHYKNVEKIEFEEITYNNMTSSWTFSTVVNDVNDISFTVSNLNNFINDLIIVLNPKEIDLVEDIKETRTIKNVDIIFSEVK